MGAVLRAQPVHRLAGEQNSPVQAPSCMPMMCRSADLRAPDGPMIDTNSPSSMLSVNWRSTHVRPVPCAYDFETADRRGPGRARSARGEAPAGAGAGAPWLGVEEEGHKVPVPATDETYSAPAPVRIRARIAGGWVPFAGFAVVRRGRAAVSRNGRDARARKPYSWGRHGRGLHDTPSHPPIGIACIGGDHLRGGLPSVRRHEPGGHAQAEPRALRYRYGQPSYAR